MICKKHKGLVQDGGGLGRKKARKIQCFCRRALLPSSIGTEALNRVRQHCSFNPSEHYFGAAVDVKSLEKKPSFVNFRSNEDLGRDRGVPGVKST